MSQLPARAGVAFEPGRLIGPHLSIGVPEGNSDADVELGEPGGADTSGPHATVRARCGH